MGKAIIRMQKLKSSVAVRRSMKHAFREQNTPNADQARTPDNTHIGAENAAEAVRRFNDALPDKVRKNAVLAVEFLVTGSPESMASKDRAAQDAYFKDALQWLLDKHGARNVVYAGIHRDETTPHMYAYVVPKDERGKLNCRSFYGEKNALSKMQTNFAVEVGYKHGLERGLEGSRAHHTKIQRYYAKVNEATLRTPSIDVPEGKLLEGKRAYGHRVAESVIDQLAPELISLRAKAQETDLAQEKAKVAEQGKKQAESQYSQRTALLEIEREKLRHLVDKQKELVRTIASGGEPLAKLQAHFREGVERLKQDIERSKQQDNEMER